MSRYFTHITSIHGFIQDQKGVELDLATTPRDLARQVAQQFQEVGAFDCKEWTIVITDELGELVLSLPLQEAMSPGSSIVEPGMCGRHPERTSGSEERVGVRTR